MDIKDCLTERNKVFIEEYPNIHQILDLKDNVLDIYIELQSLNDINCDDMILEIEKYENWFYNYVALILLGINFKGNYEKGMQSFIENFLMRKKIFEYLKENMPEFKSLTKSFSDKNRKIFQKGRASNSVLDGISFFRSAGLSSIFNRTSTKNLDKLIANPLFKEQIKILELSNIWGEND